MERGVFVGHYAPALVGKAVEPRVPLWMLFVAVQLVDIAWVVLVLLGVERVRIVPGLPSNPLAKCIVLSRNLHRHSRMSRARRTPLPPHHH